MNKCFSHWQPVMQSAHAISRDKIAVHALKSECNKTLKHCFNNKTLLRFEFYECKCSDYNRDKKHFQTIRIFFKKRLLLTRLMNDIHAGPGYFQEKVQSQRRPSVLYILQPFLFEPHHKLQYVEKNLIEEDLLLLVLLDSFWL